MQIADDRQRGQHDGEENPCTRAQRVERCVVDGARGERQQRERIHDDCGDAAGGALPRLAGADLRCKLAPPETPPAATTPTLPPARLHAYAGAYNSPTLGQVAVLQEAAGAAQGGQLVLQLEEVGARFRLQPLGGEAFSAEVLPQGRFAELAAEGFTPFYRVEFTLGADGKARGAQAVSPLASRHELVRAASR